MSAIPDTAHRPWPVPAHPWIMEQIWHDLLFAHWPLPVTTLRRVIPSTLEIDTFEGQTWIGIVPFRMSGVRPRWIPPLPWLSTFPELNVRAYVTLDGKPGVYFFSLEAGNPAAVTLARRFFHLPYFNARMSSRRDGETIYYRSRRTHHNASPAEFAARYRPTGEASPAQSGSLAEWLTARYCLYAVDKRQHVYRGEIQHSRWPLQPAEAEIPVNTMVEAHSLELPNVPPLLHFSRRLQVVIWPLERVH